MINWIDKMFKHAFEKEWYSTYWAFDVHGTILYPNFRKNHFHATFYPYAKEALQLISEREDIIMIMYTSSYPAERLYYDKVFKYFDINFKYINENPEINSTKGNFGHYVDKFYFNALFEDKAGFDPETEWEQILHLMKTYKDTNYLPNPIWETKF